MAIIMKNRATNIEWARIVAMMLIVFSHFSFHGYDSILRGDHLNNSFNEIFLRFFTTGNLGNALFMLITGYFLCKSTQIKWKRIINVVVQVFTYSFVCYLLYTLFWNKSLFCFRDIYVALTPLLHSTYWYFTTYVIIYFLHPYINKLIIQLDNKELGSLIMLLVLLWGIIPDFLNVKLGRSDFLVFLYYYMIGAYLRYYVIEGNETNKIKLCGGFWDSKRLLAICFIIWLIVAVCASFTSPTLSDQLTRLYRIGSPLTILTATSLFVLFAKRSINYSLVVNMMAGCMGGVYLLHDNPYVRKVIYPELFHLERYSDNSLMALYIIGFVMITFFVCVLIEYVRKSIYNILEKAILNS